MSRCGENKDIDGRKNKCTCSNKCGRIDVGLIRKENQNGNIRN